MIENINITGTQTGRFSSPFDALKAYPRRSADITTELAKEEWHKVDELYAELDDCSDCPDCPERDPRKCHYRPIGEESLAYCCNSCFDAEFCVFTQHVSDGVVKLFREEDDKDLFTIEVEENEIQANGEPDAAIACMSRTEVIALALSMLKAVGGSGYGHCALMEPFQVQQMIEAETERERAGAKLRAAKYLADFDLGDKSQVTYDVLYKSLLGLAEAMLDA